MGQRGPQEGEQTALVSRPLWGAAPASRTVSRTSQDFLLPVQFGTPCIFRLVALMFFKDISMCKNISKTRLCIYKNLRNVSLLGLTNG